MQGRSGDRWWLLLVLVCAAVYASSRFLLADNVRESVIPQSDRDAIAILVLRPHIARPQNDSGGWSSTCFVSVDGKDPDPTVAAALRGSNLLPGSLLPGMASEKPMGDGIRLKSNNDRAARLWVTVHPRIEHGTVTAECGYDYETGTGSGGTTYDLVKTRGIWTIVSKTELPTS